MVAMVAGCLVAGCRVAMVAGCLVAMVAMVAGCLVAGCLVAGCLVAGCLVAMVAGCLVAMMHGKSNFQSMGRVGPEAERSRLRSVHKQFFYFLQPDLKKPKKLPT